MLFCGWHCRGHAAVLSRYSEYVDTADTPTEYADTPVDQATYFRVEDTSCSLDMKAQLEVIDVTSDSECEAESHSPSCIRVN